MAVASANKEDTKAKVKRYKWCHCRDVYIF